MLLDLLDGRKHIWNLNSRGYTFGTFSKSLAYPIFLFLRFELAFIYFDAAIAKFGSKVWAEGTDVYYTVRDPMFGDSGIFRIFDLWFTKKPLGTIAFTWGTLLIEILIGIFLFVGGKFSLDLSTWLVLFLHLAIILMIGLVSFALVMISFSFIAASGLTKQGEKSFFNRVLT